jgi:hypothetical protein
LPNFSYQNYDVASGRKFIVNGSPVIRKDDASLPTAASNYELDTDLINFKNWTQTTFFISFKINVSTTNGRVFSIGKAGADDIRVYSSSTTALSVAWDDGSPLTQTFSSLNFDHDFIMIGSHDGATQRTWLYNKTLKTISFASDANTNTWSVYSGPMQIGGSPVSVDIEDVDVEYMFLSDRAVTSNNEVLAFIDNPYQILKPKTEFIFIETGAAPTGRIMSSLVNYGGLAGHGGLAGKGGGLAG